MTYSPIGSGDFSDFSIEQEEIYKEPSAPPAVDAPVPEPASTGVSTAGGESQPTEATASPQPEVTQPEKTGPRKSEGFFEKLVFGETVPDLPRPPTGPAANEKPTELQQTAVAPLAGVADTASDTLSFFTNGGIKIPKMNKFENQAIQGLREASGFIIPEIYGVGLLNRLGKLAHSRVGWKIGNTAWMRFIGNLGIDVGLAGGISAVKEEGADPGNFFDLFRLLPGGSAIADNLGSGNMDPGSPDLIRERNLKADMGLAFTVPLVGPALKIVNARTRVGKLSVPKGAAKGAADEISIVGNNAPSQAWVDGNPSTYTDDAAEGLLRYSLDQENALDELGRYNLARVGPDDANVALKGVHDLFDYNEIGMRTVDDFGIIGQSIDQARIAGNKGTVYGRIRNVISPGALKYTADNLDTVDEITLGLSKTLDDVDDITVSGKGFKFDSADLAKAGEDLVMDYLDPTMDISGIRRLFGKQIKKLPDGTEILSPAGYADLKKLFVKLGKEFNDMSVLRAEAYVGTSLAGQVSDVAEAARYSRGTEVAVKAAQEKILDNMKYILRLKGSSNYYRGLKSSMSGMWDTTQAVTKQTPEELAANYKGAMDTLNREIDIFADDLAYTFNNYPEAGEAIMELFELTDGRVWNLTTVSDTLKKSFGWANPLTAADPNTPNLIAQAARGNFFNSMLSAMGTPIRATLGNITGLVDEPVTYFAGALMRKDMKSIADGFYAYRSLSSIQDKAFPLMKRLYQKAASNVDSVTGATDIDFSIKTDNKLNALRNLSRAEAARGNTGAQIMIDHYLNLQEMAQDPALRFSANAMTGLDGLPQAMYANGEARFRALEEVARRGDDVGPKELESILNSEYDSMFDANGLIKDKASLYGSDRISLRANTPTAQAINDMVTKFPWTRVFFPFPGTQANIINLLDETIPAPFRSFQKDINELAYTSVETFQGNPQLMREILERKGYNVDMMDETAQLGALIRMKNKVLGRKALTTSLMGGFTALYFNGRVTGRGLYDKEAQLSRERNSKIPKDSVMGLDGRWYSYKEILGPGYGNWVSTLITALENVNYIGAGALEDIEKKLSFIFAGVLQEESGLSALEPMFEMFAGNSQAMNSWAANRLNSLAPMAGMRNELGNLLNGGLRLVDNNLFEYLENKNKVLGLLPGGDLPVITNPLDGTVPNRYNPILRLWNTYMPIKVTDTASENQLFLDRVGHSYSTMFTTKDGIPLETDERGRLMEIVAEDGYFKRDVERIRKKAERMGYYEKLKEVRANGGQAEDMEEFMGIREELRAAQKLAEDFAYTRLDYKYASAIAQRKAEKERRSAAAGIGITDFLKQTNYR